MKMRNVVPALLALLLVACMTHSAFAVTVLGHNPYVEPPLQTVDDLKDMVRNNPVDIKTGLEKAGNGDIYDDFMAQLPTAEIETVYYQKGQDFKWMFYRKNGKGPVRVDQVLTYEGDAPVPSYEFFIDHNGDRYTFAVPMICGNIALLDVSPTPATPAVVEPETPAVVEPETVVVEEAPMAPVVAAAVKPLPWVVDLGIIYQTDPATYGLVRAGYEHYFNENFSLLGMVGVAGKMRGSDGASAFLVEAFANYHYNKGWVGVGLGGWFSDEDERKDWDDDDTDLDLIIDLGYEFYEKPNEYKVSGFLEIRSGIDEIDDFDLYGMLGGGIRVNF